MSLQSLICLFVLNLALIAIPINNYSLKLFYCPVLAATSLIPKQLFRPLAFVFRLAQTPPIASVSLD